MAKITIVFDEDEKRYFLEKLENDRRETRPLPHPVAAVLLQCLEKSFELSAQLASLPIEEADMLPQHIAQGVVHGKGTFTFFSPEEYRLVRLQQMLESVKGSEDN